jgi:hypothetical protein
MATAKRSPASTSRAIMPWDEEMAAAAKRQAAVEKPMGLFKQIAISAGIMSIDEKKVPNNELRVIVLAATHENQYYDKPFKPGVPAVPACYAFGDPGLEDPEAEMYPHPDAERKQGDDEGKCAGCWANKMASADTGKGKACSNVRRLIVTTEDALESPQAMAQAEARSLKVPVMSVKNWVNFVHQIEEDMKRPYFGVIAKVKVVPDAKSQWQVQFFFEELIQFNSELYAALKKRCAQAAKDLQTPYPKLEDQEDKKPAAGKRPAAKPTGPTTRAKSKF